MLVLTEWAEYVALDPDELTEHVAARGSWTAATVSTPSGGASAGWTYRALGRP